jgi:hypothetical protein
MKVFEISNFLAILEVHDSEEAALDKIKGRSSAPENKN